MATDPLDILYVDNHLLAVNKPAGLVTQPSGHHADSLESRARAWVAREYRKPGRVFLEAVHRIDRPVSGVVLFARTGKSLSRLNEALRQGMCDKLYHAIVEGTPEPACGRLEDWLVHASRRAVLAKASLPGAKRAVLTYRVLKTLAEAALVEIRLHTGRYHQIRVQLSHAGHPVVGDSKYGARRQTCAKTVARIALHHRRLEVPHPVRNTPVVLEAEPPSGHPWSLFPSHGLALS